MKVKRSTWLPVLLLIYLAVMAYMGIPSLKTGQTKPGEYAAIIVITLVCIALLHFFLKKRENRRQPFSDNPDNSKNK